MLMMNRLVLPVLIVALAALAPDGAAAQRRGDQYDAYQARRAGQVMPLREIEARVVPRMRGASYLGPEFDQSSGMYRLKFMRDGTVIWVDVDGRTGAVIGRSGN